MIYLLRTQLTRLGGRFGRQGEFDGQIAALNAKFATREKELLDEIERLRQAVGLALKVSRNTPP